MCAASKDDILNSLPIRDQSLPPCQRFFRPIAKPILEGMPLTRKRAECAYVGLAALDLHQWFASYLQPKSGRLPCPNCHSFSLTSKGVSDCVRRGYDLDGIYFILSWKYSCEGCTAAVGRDLI